jgi:hypothetical protein
LAASCGLRIEVRRQRSWSRPLFPATACNYHVPRKLRKQSQCAENLSKNCTQCSLVPLAAGEKCPCRKLSVFCTPDSYGRSTVLRLPSSAQSRRNQRRLRRSDLPANVVIKRAPLVSAHEMLSSAQDRTTVERRNYCPTKALLVTSNPSLGVSYVGFFVVRECAEKIGFLRSSLLPCNELKFSAHLLAKSGETALSAVFE